MRAIAEQAFTTVYRCGRCNKGIRTGWAFCAWCGEPVENPPLEEMKTELTVNDEA